MDRIFSFDSVGKCIRTNHEFDALCVYFSNKHELSCLEFYSDLEASLKAVDLLPDCVVMIADAKMCVDIELHWSNDLLKKSFVKRGEKSGKPFVKYYYLYCWSVDGFIEVFRASADSDSVPSYELDIEDLVKQGSHDLVGKNNVVQVAPVGHLFKHPSGTRNNIFVQARELAKTEPELCFVGRLISLAFGFSKFSDLSVVYVDSMGIYQFVREALEFCGVNARIHSFHSYDEMRKLTPPRVEHLVVISASTSGGMARDLEVIQGFKDDRILTLIDRSHEERHGKVLISLEEIDKSFFNFDADGFETEIELVGEHFSSKAKPPRAVTLGKPHAPQRLLEFLKAFGKQGLNQLNEIIDGEPKVLSLAGDTVSKNKNFLAWLNKEVSWRVSISTSTIICTDDNGSREIAEIVAALISEHNGGKKPTILTYGHIVWDEAFNASGILVVTAVARDGGVLREISRDLRERLNPTIDCPRHYLIAVGLPQSKETWSRLRQFLERNASNRLYGFSEWLVLPIGSERQGNHWSDLSLLANKSQVIDINSSEVSSENVQRSLDMVSKNISKSFNGFLPKTDGSKLSLSAGFIYFGEVFGEDVSEALYATSYLAIASALQKARDIDDIANQLRSTGYESVILSPECFLRFNDNILHACILRGCRKGELDYSSSPHHSKLMSEFLLKVFTRHDLPYGAAANEFASALATQRLKLKKSDQSKLIGMAIEKLKDTPSLLLGLLLMVGV